MFSEGGIALGSLVADNFHLNSEQRNAYSAALAQTSQYVVALGAVLGIVFWRRKGKLSSLGWRLPRWWWIPLAALIGLLTIPAITTLAQYAQQVIQHFYPSAENGQISQVQGSYGSQLWIAVPVVSVVAPVVEETFFRGFIYGWLRKRLAVPWAAIISGLFFAAVHFEPVIFAPLAVLGIVLALLYEYSRSLLPGVIVHGTFNFIEILQIL